MLTISGSHSLDPKASVWNPKIGLPAHGCHVNARHARALGHYAKAFSSREMGTRG